MTIAPWHRRIARLVLRAACGPFFVGVAAFAQTTPASLPPTSPEFPPGKIRFDKITGDVTVRNASGQTRKVLVDTPIVAGERIITPANGGARLGLSNGVKIGLGDDTEFVVTTFTQRPFSGTPDFAEVKLEPSPSRTWLWLERGSVTCSVPALRGAEGARFELLTPVGALGIRGTAFTVSFKRDATGAGILKLIVHEGLVLLMQKDQVPRHVAAGQTSEVIAPPGTF